MRDHEGKLTDGHGLREKLKPERMDYGKPGDPSGCYFPHEWRSPGAVIGHENRDRVRTYFVDHIGCTNVECARALNLSVMAVGRHVAKLRLEWEGGR